MRQQSTNSEIRSVAPPGWAWMIRISSDKAVTSSFRYRADFASGRRGRFSKGERINRRPDSKGGSPIGRKPDLYQRSRQANDDWLLSSQKNPQAFVFDWRVKTTDYGYAFIAELSGSVIGSKDGVTGATDRAKQRSFGLRQRCQAAQRGQGSWSVVAQPFSQTDGITGISRSQYRWIHPRVAKLEWIPLPEQEELRQV